MELPPPSAIAAFRGHEDVLDAEKGNCESGRRHTSLGRQNERQDADIQYDKSGTMKRKGNSSQANQNAGNMQPECHQPRSVCNTAHSVVQDKTTARLFVLDNTTARSTVQRSPPRMGLRNLGSMSAQFFVQRSPPRAENVEFTSVGGLHARSTVHVSRGEAVVQTTAPAPAALRPCNPPVYAQDDSETNGDNGDTDEEDPAGKADHACPCRDTFWGGKSSQPQPTSAKLTLHQKAARQIRIDFYCPRDVMLETLRKPCCKRECLVGFKTQALYAIREGFFLMTKNEQEATIQGQIHIMQDSEDLEEASGNGDSILHVDDKGRKYIQFVN